VDEGDRAGARHRGVGIKTLGRVGVLGPGRHDERQDGSLDWPRDRFDDGGPLARQQPIGSASRPSEDMNHLLVDVGPQITAKMGDVPRDVEIRAAA
jgi:hypothetical protein